MTPSDSSTRPFGALRLPSVLGWAALAGLAALGCSGGNRFTGDHPGQANSKLMITPSTATVLTGQSLRFTANSPWGGDVTWYVLPAAGGTCDGQGTFQASSTLGRYQIVALWNRDVRYTATATVFVVSAAAHHNPNLVQASGLPQTSGTGGTRNAPVVGEPVPATRSVTASRTIQVRHGFDPPFTP